MSIQPKNVALTSLLAGYGNINRTPWVAMNISGSIANGNSATFTTSFTADQSNSNYMWDLVGYNPTAEPFTNTYSILNQSVNFGIDTFIYKSTATESTTFTSTWNSSTNSFVVTCVIFNGTGSTITLVNQTAYFAGIYYLAPF